MLRLGLNEEAAVPSLPFECFGLVAVECCLASEAQRIRMFCCSTAVGTSGSANLSIPACLL